MSQITVIDNDITRKDNGCRVHVVGFLMGSHGYRSIHGGRSVKELACRHRRFCGLLYLLFNNVSNLLQV